MSITELIMTIANVLGEKGIVLEQFLNSLLFCKHKERWSDVCTEGRVNKGVSE